MPTNRAAWITAPTAHPLEVKEAPYPTPGPKDIVAKTVAVAMNPLEYKIQDYNPPIGGNPIQYPMILGSDMAGIVTEIGSEVSSLKVGDHIIAHTFGQAIGEPAKSAFQEYVLMSDWAAIPVPQELPLEKAVVLPLAADSAMAGLFVQLGLSLVGMKGLERPRGVVLIWGGSSSVGATAVQFASAAGYDVIATASAKNHELVRSLGAKEVFDYGDEDVEAKAVAAMKGKSVVGAMDCIADGKKTLPACARILNQAGGLKKIVSVLSPYEEVEGVPVVRVMIPALISSPVFGIVRGWMVKALAEGRLQCKPDPMVVGEGLESIQKGIDVLRKGVSAAKVVVKLE